MKDDVKVFRVLDLSDDRSCDFWRPFCDLCRIARQHVWRAHRTASSFDMPFALKETLILLTSSFTCALATLALYRKQKFFIIFWFLVTFALGAAFLYLELSEFSRFIHAGAGWERSAFLSAFFALVGTHGLHISVGMLWMIVAIFRVYFRKLSALDISRITRLAYFWHFLDVVWIFIFTVVYAMGHLL